MNPNILQSQFSKYTHPFNIKYNSIENSQYEAFIYKNSYVYLPPKSASGEITQLSISKLDAKKKFSLEQASDGLYAVLKIDVQSLQAQSASIEWQTPAQGVKSLELDSQKNQASASIILGVIRSDQNYLGSSSSGPSSLYVDQNINTNLIIANMVFNGVPVIFPVPFPGVFISNS